MVKHLRQRLRDVGKVLDASATEQLPIPIVFDWNPEQREQVLTEYRDKWGCEPPKVIVIERVSARKQHDD